MKRTKLLVSSLTVHDIVINLFQANEYQKSITHPKFDK